MNINDLTPEQIEKAKACKTNEDLLALAKEEGLELSDEQLQAVAGGWIRGSADNDADDLGIKEVLGSCRLG